jgi:hypothetical protein
MFRDSEFISGNAGVFIATAIVAFCTAGILHGARTDVLSSALSSKPTPDSLKTLCQALGEKLYSEEDKDKIIFNERQRTIIAAIVKILPLAQPGVLLELSRSQAANLYKCIGDPVGPPCRELQLMILEQLLKARDTRAIEQVALAICIHPKKDKSSEYVARLKEVKKALEAQKEIEEVSRPLLRASSAAEAEGRLLRVPGPGEPVDGEQLLRPHDGEN